MVEFTRNEMVLILTVLLHFTGKCSNTDELNFPPGSRVSCLFLTRLRLCFMFCRLPTAVTGLRSILIRDGDDVTLPCDNVIDDQFSCNATTWVFIDSSENRLVELIAHGKTCESVISKTISVSGNCSLVIKKVTVEHVNRYTCQQYKSGERQGEDSPISLTVVTSEYLHPSLITEALQYFLWDSFFNSLTSSPVTEHEEDDEVTVNCSLSSYKGCKGEVKWLFNDQDAKDQPYVTTSSSPCRATASFKSQDLLKTKSLQCEVSDGSNRQLFTLKSAVEDSIKPPGGESSCCVRAALILSRLRCECQRDFLWFDLSQPLWHHNLTICNASSIDATGFTLVIWKPAVSHWCRRVPCASVTDLRGMRMCHCTLNTDAFTPASLFHVQGCWHVSSRYKLFLGGFFLFRFQHWLVWWILVSPAENATEEVFEMWLWKQLVDWPLFYFLFRRSCF